MKPFVNSGRKTVKAEEPPSVPFVLYGVAPRPRRTCLDGRILPAFFYCLTISFNPHPPCRETPCGIGRLLCSGIFALPRKCTLCRCVLLFICRRFLFFLKKSRCKITKQSDNFFRILKLNQKKVKKLNSKIISLPTSCCHAPFRWRKPTLPCSCLPPWKRCSQEFLLSLCCRCRRLTPGCKPSARCR